MQCSCSYQTSNFEEMMKHRSKCKLPMVQPSVELPIKIPVYEKLDAKGKLLTSASEGKHSSSNHIPTKNVSSANAVPKNVSSANPASRKPISDISLPAYQTKSSVSPSPLVSKHNLVPNTNVLTATVKPVTNQKRFGELITKLKPLEKKKKPGLETRTPNNSTTRGKSVRKTLGPQTMTAKVKQVIPKESLFRKLLEMPLWNKEVLPI